MENKKKLSKKTWIIIVAVILTLAIVGTAVGIVISHNKKETNYSDTIDIARKLSGGKKRDPSEPDPKLMNLSGQEIVKASKEGKDGFCVKKSGDQYILYLENEKLSPGYYGLAPVTIKELDSRRQLYYFSDGILDQSYSGYLKCIYGIYWVTDGKVDVYDDSDNIVEMDDAELSDLYFKYNQWQHKYTGVLETGTTEDGMVWSYDIKDGKVTGWTDSSGHHDYY